jgi:multiple sugar transport system permease protein
MKKKLSLIQLLLGILLFFMALLALLPFILMVLTSFTDKESIDFSFKASDFTLRNYLRIFRNLNIGRNIFNSAVITVSACILNCLISSMAAFGFAKKQFPGRDKLFLVYLATLMIPIQVTLIPYFIIIRKLGLINTYAALVLPIDAFGVFLIRQFILNLPNDLLEAATIDGCSEPQIFITIVIPLIKAVLISLTIFTFISSWNEFLRPLIVFTKIEMQTLTMAINTLKGNYYVNYGLVTAGTTLAFLIPFVLYIVLQKQFVEGIALSGIKS